jgi:hypothetical protein
MTLKLDVQQIEQGRPSVEVAVDRLTGSGPPTG